MSVKQQKSTRLCGTCQHYSWTLGPQRKTTCNNLGCIELTPHCPDYSINPFVLQDFENVLKPLADVLRVMPVTTLSMFLEIIGQERSLRRAGYYFMEKVAVKYWGTPGQKFVSNYVIAHVYSADKEGVFVIAKSGIRMYVLRESVIKLEAFIDIRRDLKERGKIVDPTLSSRASAKQKLAVSETLDDIIARGLVDEDDLDSDIKRKLNPKRISNNLDKDHRSTDSGEATFSTKKKKKKELDAADEFILSKTKSLSRELVPAVAPAKSKTKPKAAAVIASAPIAVMAIEKVGKKKLQAVSIENPVIKKKKKKLLGGSK